MSKLWTLFLIFVLVLVYAWIPASTLPVVWAGVVYFYAFGFTYVDYPRTTKHRFLKSLFWPVINK